LDKSEQVVITPVPSGSAGLRILLIVNLNWDARLGAVRVFMELADAWRAVGHAVETFSLSDAFPGRSGSPALFAIRQALFRYKAAAFVRKNAARFDVVDALIGSLHGSKKKLRFPGLLVARSVGLYRLYDRFEQEARERWSRSEGKVSGKIFYTLVGWWSRRACDAAVRRADLVNVPNDEEAACLRQEVNPDLAVTVQPYGLNPERRKALAASAATPVKRLSAKKVCFLGMWAPRKGSRDWAELVRNVWNNVPEARFCFLGTMVEQHTIFSDLGLQPSAKIECVVEYSQEDLPALLADCAAGAFPSYVEGFGIAVLEQIAAGIPTVAFDVAGPRNILGPELSKLLIPAGDVHKFAEALIDILECDPAAYEQLARRSSERARSFAWTDIAQDTAEVYRARLAAVRAKRPIPGHA
jgi:glycosyltransferase involved in cell wall biosynthesis